MRYKIIDVYKFNNTPCYIAKCLKVQSPQYIVIHSPRTLCKDLDIIDVNLNTSCATWATGEKISLNILHQLDSLDRLYEIDH